MSASADPMDAYKEFMAKHKPAAAKAASDKSQEKPDAHPKTNKNPEASSSAKDGKVYETYTYDERSQSGGEGTGMPSATKTRTSGGENPVEVVDEDDESEIGRAHV